MNTQARQALSGIVVALLSLALILGSLTLSLVETGAPLAQAASPTPTFNLDDIPTLAYILPAELTLTALAGMPTPTLTATPARFSACAPPGWIAVTIQLDDTLSSLALVYGSTVEELRRGNCLTTDALSPGAQIYVPPPRTFTATLLYSLTPTATPCVKRLDWPVYYVRSGDTLYGLSLILRISQDDLRRANCMAPNQVTIYAGQPLHVPFIPVFTPAPTSTSHPPTGSPTPTWPSPTFTDTSAPTPSDTPTPGSETPTPSETPVPSETPTVPPPPTETPTAPPYPAS